MARRRKRLLSHRSFSFLPCLHLIRRAAGVHACNPGSGRQRQEDQFKGIFGKTTNGGKPGMQETLLQKWKSVLKRKMKQSSSFMGPEEDAEPVWCPWLGWSKGRVQRKRSRNLSGEQIGPQVFKPSPGWYALSWATHFTGGHLRFKYSFHSIPPHQPIKLPPSWREVDSPCPARLETMCLTSWRECGLPGSQLTKQPVDELLIIGTPLYNEGSWEF